MRVLALGAVPSACLHHFYRVINISLHRRGETPNSRAIVIINLGFINRVVPFLFYNARRSVLDSICCCDYNTKSNYVVAEFVGQYHGWAIPIPEEQGYVN